MLKQVLGAIVLTSSISGCLTTTVHTDTQPGVMSYEERENYFIGGLFPEEKNFKASELCPSRKLTRIETETTFVDGLFGLFTLGIYSPKTVKAWCRGKAEGGSDA